jgi:hypothetical protein
MAIYAAEVVLFELSSDEMKCATLGFRCLMRRQDMIGPNTTFLIYETWVISVGMRDGTLVSRLAPSLIFLARSLSDQSPWLESFNLRPGLNAYNPVPAWICT